MAAYTKLNLKQDVEDMAPRFGYSPGMDFGGFYTGATIAWRADYEHLGDIETQKNCR